MRDGMRDEKSALRRQMIIAFLQAHEYIMNADVRSLCGVSAATANRILGGLVSEGIVEKTRAGGHWVYKSR